MPNSLVIKGFSKLSRSEKLSWLQKQADLSASALQLLERHLHPDPELQEVYGGISENNITNYFLPMGLAPNFLVNGNLVTVPMVIEESSVVAAASHAAKFWTTHGGFHSEVKGTVKTGQVHFTWSGSEEDLQKLFRQNREKLLDSVRSLTGRMEQRGGGIEEIGIRRGSVSLQDYYQLFVEVHTADAMGANFINSVLEVLAGQFPAMVNDAELNGELEVVMSILSNYTPECLVACHLEGKTEIFGSMDPRMSGEEFARRFKLAVDIACEDTHRAVTHNKGIFNGMDAVILATGNDFRAVEACGHAFASREGRYGSLSRVDLSGTQFRFTLEVPLAVGTVGGLTGSHPMAAVALEILGDPSAEQLMQVVAAAGLANNFSAVRSLITTGIQAGHMKLHLGNILRQLKANRDETGLVTEHFRERPVTHTEVSAFLANLRDQNQR